MEVIGLDASYTPVYRTSLRGQYSWSYRAGDLKCLMADYSTTTARISILFFGGCWAQRQLHAGRRYVTVGSKPMKSVSSVEGVSMLTLAEFYSIADSSTTAARIPILIEGGCWA